MDKFWSILAIAIAYFFGTLIVFIVLTRGNVTDQLLKTSTGFVTAETQLFTKPQGG